MTPEPDRYVMLLISNEPDTSVTTLEAQRVHERLTRFVGTLLANVHSPRTFVGVELWHGHTLINSQDFDSPITTTTGAEIIVTIDLEHRPGQVDLWQFADITPPKFDTIEEAQAWLDTRA